jgi:hypothetical protein
MFAKTGGALVSFAASAYRLRSPKVARILWHIAATGSLDQAYIMSRLQQFARTRYIAPRIMNSTRFSVFTRSVESKRKR